MNLVDFDKISVEGENLLGFSDILNNLKNGEYKDQFNQQRNESNNNNTGNSNNLGDNNNLDNNNNNNSDNKTEEQWLTDFKDL